MTPGFDHVVAAKISPPKLRQNLVPRQGVLGLLAAGSGSLLTVVQAPPGYGKSTVIRAWAGSQAAETMWVNLDGGDEDPYRLWAHIAAAAERALPGRLGTVTQELAEQGAAVDEIVFAILDVWGQSRKRLVLVLDDLHTVTGGASLESIAVMLQHMPNNVRTVIGSRTDPPLAIARLRASQELTELRAADLAFSPSEARTLLCDVQGLALTDEQVSGLVAKTEGWPAMLVLIGLWLRGADDVGVAITELGSNQRFIADYLGSEVLDALEPDKRRFVQSLAVLGQFTAEMCDAVMDTKGSASRIVELMDDGFFVTRLTDGRWFRMHPLFSEYARLRLEAENPGEATRIHQHAAQYLASREPTEALAHASQADDQLLVAQLLTEHHLELIRSGAGRTLMRWARTLPDEVLLEFPEVIVAAAVTSLLTSGGVMERTRFVGLADRALAESKAPADGYVAAVREISLALSLDEGAQSALVSGRRAVELVRDRMPDLVDGALTAQGRVLYFVGDYEQARAHATEALLQPMTGRSQPSVIHAHTTLALVAVEEGRLTAAREHAELASATPAGRGAVTTWLGANAASARGAVLLAEGDTAQAYQDFVKAEGAFREELPSVHHTWALINVARAEVRRGRISESLRSATRARDALAELPDPAMLPRLLDELDGEIQVASDGVGLGPLLTPLSPAELGILELMAEGLSIREMSIRLFVSENTVTTHRRGIYRKLGVSSRSDALARAGALGVLGSDLPHAGTSPG